MTGRNWIEMGDDVVFEKLWRDFRAARSGSWGGAAYGSIEALQGRIARALGDSGRYVGDLVQKGEVWTAPSDSAPSERKFFRVLGVRPADRRAYGLSGPSRDALQTPQRIALHRFGKGGSDRLVLDYDLSDLL